MFFARGSLHTIMKSKDAFNVPHIVLTEAPATDDSDEVYESNLLPNCGYQFAGWLCVPNAPVFAFDVSDYHFNAERDYIDLEDDLVSSDEETETSTETSEVGTPPLASHAAMDSFTTVHAVHRKLAEIHGGDHCDLQPQSVAIFQVDDDDDLPEFDEWYSSIAQRAE
ncbi:hypothetical protein CYLTODRAFT_213626 [Cylindrobasidium torrendii FP15055 ss-10]|uniref:Uncharacterized protein n=1 Tax=Cylindrobasidium torrendii FP15055 ss-10 TaxID=1314674 RepID=A0A0D7BGU4_9AGAR|nr:hypothetical protein CYLTODRAFT_213626 [Cylindrobasidium torrendii FP15055 ss-10]